MTNLKFRDFNASDLSAMLKVVRNVGLDKMAGIFTRENLAAVSAEGGSESEVGFAVVLRMLDVIIEHIDAVKESLDCLLIRVCEDECAESIPDLPLDDYIGILEQVAFDTNFLDCWRAAVRFYNRAGAKK